MWQDPIVAETRALRDEYARQFNYSIDDIFEDLMTKQAAHPERSNSKFAPTACQRGDVAVVARAAGHPSWSRTGAPR
jgi:hypothetical protein